MTARVRRRPGLPEKLLRGLCPPCGKARYLSRSEARRAARGMFPGLHHKAVPCGAYWHIKRVWGEDR